MAPTPTNLPHLPHLLLLLLLLLLAASTGVWATGSGFKAARDYGASGSHSHMRQHHHDRSRGRTEGHHHHRPRQTLENPKLLQDSDLVHDTEHMKEEMPEYLTPETIKNMSPRELDYHYFKLHDFDENLRLDGLELLAALGHVHGDDDDDDDDDEGGVQGGHGGQGGLSEEQKRIRENFMRQKYEEDFRLYIQLIDEVFEDNDTDKDGFLSWGEYLKGRQRNDEKRKGV
ncbi:lymphotoxin beta receptor inhibitor isoform X2 [Penaeus vannamei]|uniref:lymphotoxin beta receptor inhibitor isoform X2 n=1 Tax=Penaeus vannamei TaxID=6689 RepID=UPI00387F4733